VGGATTINAFLQVNYVVESKTRYGFLITAETDDGIANNNLVFCTPADIPKGPGFQRIPFVYTCGTSLRLLNTFTAWDNQTPGSTVCNNVLTNPTTGAVNCTAATPKCKFYADPFVVITCATPATPVITATQQPTCSTSTGQISVSNPNSSLTYSIYKAPSTTALASNSTGVFSGLESGSYTVKAASGACISTASNSVTINTAAGAPATPTVGVKTAASCSSSNIVLQVTGPTPLSDYEFRNREGDWQTSNEFTIKAGEGYSITVRRISDRTCVSGAATCEAETSTPLTSQSSSSLKALDLKEREITAYPVPFRDHVSIEFKSNRNGNYTINMYDSKGKLVKELKTGKAKAGQLQNIQVDGRSLPDGMYFIRVIDSSGSKTVKLLKKE